MMLVTQLWRIASSETLVEAGGMLDAMSVGTFIVKVNDIVLPNHHEACNVPKQLLNDDYKANSYNFHKLWSDIQKLINYNIHGNQSVHPCCLNSSKDVHQWSRGRI